MALPAPGSDLGWIYPKRVSDPNIIRSAVQQFPGWSSDDIAQYLSNNNAGVSFQELQALANNVGGDNGSVLSGNSPPSGGGGGGAAAPVFNAAGVRNTQRTIDELPDILARALASEKTNYKNAQNQFNTQETGQRKTYDTSTVTNQQNYDSNFMDSIRSGIKGLGGLMQILRGTGAAGGTAEDEARDVVGGVTSNDIRVGADAREENQTTLDSSLEGFLTELQRKRQIAEDTRVNNERALRRDSDTQLQKLFGDMAGFYGDVNNTAQANSWMNRAGQLTPRIAANSATKTSLYDTSPIAVKAPELTAFADPTQPSIVTAPDGQVGSGIFTMADPRRRREQAAPVGV